MVQRGTDISCYVAAERGTKAVEQSSADEVLEWMTACHLHLSPLQHSAWLVTAQDHLTPSAAPS